MLKFTPYNFELVHRKGAHNKLPDALSRIHEGKHTDIEGTQTIPLLYPELLNQTVSSQSEELGPIASLQLQHQSTDEWYTKMLNMVKTHPNRFPNFTRQNDQLYIKFKNKPNTDHYWEYKFVVPESKRQDVMSENHDLPTAGHLGIKKTKTRIIQKYFWPKMARDIEAYVKKCIICRESKSSNRPHQGLMGKPKSASMPFQMLAIDLVGPLVMTTKQNTYIFVVCDWFTKFPFFFPLRSANATKIVQILENEIFMNFGVCEVIIMDNGKQFIANITKSLFKKYGIEKVWYNSVYHPQNNFVERTNKTLGNMLRCFSRENHRHWDVLLPQLALALRTAINEVTGYSPFFLTFARECPLSAADYELKPTEHSDGQAALDTHCEFLVQFREIFNTVSHRIRKSYDKNKSAYDQNRIEVSHNTGDIVYKRNFPQSDAGKRICAKLLPKFTRCVVAQKRSPLSYDLIDFKGKPLGNYHIKDILPA